MTMNINEKIKQWREEAPSYNAKRRQEIEENIMSTLNKEIKYIEDKIRQAIFDNKNIATAILYSTTYKRVKNHFAAYGIKVRRTIPSYLFHWMDYLVLGPHTLYKVKVNFKNGIENI